MDIRGKETCEKRLASDALRPGIKVNITLLGLVVKLILDKLKIISAEFR